VKEAHHLVLDLVRLAQPERARDGLERREVIGARVSSQAHRRTMGAR
jgi:hypothetical protein